MSTPNAMPARKINKVQEKVLGSLIETHVESWQFKQFNDEDELVKTKVSRSVPRYALAGNVSELSIERTARRWVR